MVSSQSTLALPEGHENSNAGDVFLEVGSIQYVAPSLEHELASEGSNLSLVTVIQAPDGNKAIDETWIAETISRFEASDDVFQTAFLSIVIFTIAADTGKFDITEAARKYLAGKGTHTIRNTPQSGKHDPLLPGPYVIVENRLRVVWRIYDDNHGAFVSSLRPQNGPFVEFKRLGSDSPFPVVAVSSRLSCAPTEDKPLNGLRFAIKDIFNLKGIRTSFGSKAYLNTYEPQSETAETVEQLIKLGAMITGKLKLTQFGNWEEPIEYTEYQAPWNPRGDGFQSPGGSSSGPATALAAYEWLDITLGSDTTGSVMRPSLWGGLFALRPTFGAVSYKGIGKGVEFLDSVGCFGRDLTFLQTFCDVWLDHSRLIEEPKAFTSIVWASDMWDGVEEHQQDLAQAFIADIETHFDLKTTKLSFQQRWKEAPPKEAGAYLLDEYMNKACEDVYFEYYQHLQVFAQVHKQKFGRPPYLSAPNVEFWDYLESVSEAEYATAVEHVDVYRKWFWKEYFEDGKAHPLFVLPIEFSSPRYRDEVPNFRRPPPGVNTLALSPIMKAPELLLPIGETLYESRITKREEKLPFVIGLMFSPGTDLYLIQKTIDVLKKSNRPTKVSTGRLMWP